jgi:hypothetical protein
MRLMTSHCGILERTDISFPYLLLHVSFGVLPVVLDVYLYAFILLLFTHGPDLDIEDSDR